MQYFNNIRISICSWYATQYYIMIFLNYLVVRLLSCRSTRSCCHSVGHPFTWLLDHLVIRLLDHSVTRRLDFSGYPVLQLPGRSVTRLSSRPITGSLGHLVTCSYGYSVTQPLGYPVARSLGLPDTRSPDLLNNSTTFSVRWLTNFFRFALLHRLAQQLELLTAKHGRKLVEIIPGTQT